MNRDELFKKLKEAKRVEWMGNEYVQRFYINLIKWSAFIIPFMFAALIVNGGLIFDGIMIVIYLSMFIRVVLQKPYEELRVYSYQTFGNDKALKNTLEAIDYIKMMEKGIKDAETEVEKTNLYNKMVGELDEKYGKGQHLFLSIEDVAKREEIEAVIKVQEEHKKAVEEAKKNYKEKVMALHEQSEKEAKEILTKWFAPIFPIYKELVMEIRKIETMQYNMEVTKNERIMNIENQKEVINDKAKMIIEIVNDIRNKYEEFKTDIDMEDDLDYNTHVCKRLYDFAIREYDEEAYGTERQIGLCNILENRMRKLMIMYNCPYTCFNEKKQAYEKFQFLGQIHPEITAQDYQLAIFGMEEDKRREMTPEVIEARKNKKEREVADKIKWQKKQEKISKNMKRESEKRIKEFNKKWDRQIKELSKLSKIERCK